MARITIDRKDILHQLDCSESFAKKVSDYMWELRDKAHKSQKKSEE